MNPKNFPAVFTALGRQMKQQTTSNELLLWNSRNIIEESTQHNDTQKPQMCTHIRKRQYRFPPIEHH